MLFEKYAGQSEQWWNFRWLPYSLTIQQTELIRGAYEQGIFLLHGNGVLALSSYGGIGRECVVAGREEFAEYSAEAVGFIPKNRTAVVSSIE